jgi:hypothetical protein
MRKSFMKIFTDEIEASLFTLKHNGTMHVTRNGRFMVYFD